MRLERTPFSNLLPGLYTLNASLPGFQTKTYTDLQLSQNTSFRYNFELAIAGVNTQVEVSISAGTILATQGASVGQVLNQQKVQDLPLVGNNILDLITVMAGVENIIPTNPPVAGNAFGREQTTFAGVRADNISVVRDGIQVQDKGFQLARNSNGISSVTTINPDLVGEIRLILAPVDVELGRGNGAISVYDSVRNQQVLRQRDTGVSATPLWIRIRGRTTAARPFPSSQLPNSLHRRSRETRVWPQLATGLIRIS